MMKIFRKELFIKDATELGMSADLIQEAIDIWVTECDGKEVVNGQISALGSCTTSPFLIFNEWCEEI